MPAEVFEDVLELEIDLLEASMPTLETRSPSYPLPSLIRSGRREVRPFKVYILENDLIRISFLPELGGRIWSIFDRRTQTEMLNGTHAVSCVEGGLRGVVATGGLQMSLFDGDRLNSMGEMSVQVISADESDDPVGIRFCDALAGNGLTLEWTVSLGPSESTLDFTVKVYNRLDRSVEVLPSLSLFDPRAIAEGDGIISVQDRSLLVVTSEDFALPITENGGWARHSKSYRIASHQSDSFSFRLTTYPFLRNVTSANDQIACSLEPGELKLHSAVRRMGHRVLLLTSQGQTLEAPVDLHPEQPLVFALEGPLENAQGVVVQDPNRSVIFSTQTQLATIPDLSLHVLDLEDYSPAGLWLATRNVALRSAAYFQLALLHTRSGAFEQADQLLELSLQYNGDDTLAWWLKSAVRRLNGDPLEDRPELLNAHFLSPQEPVLRAESFLSQPNDGNADPHPLLVQLTVHPEQFIEVACLLIDAGLWEQAARFLDEALRHEKLAMLHVLMSFALLESSKMDMEAAQQASYGAALATLPPFPHRPVEIAALAKVNERFALPALIALERLVRFQTS